jgi:HSP20 family protein
MLKVYARPVFFDGVRRYEPVEFNGGRRLPVDLHVDQDEFVLTADVAGMKPEDLKIEIHDGVLTLKGEVKPQPNGEGKYILHEISCGEFSRSLMLPDHVDVDKAEARIENGLLQIRLPKSEEAKPRVIQVKAK